MCFLSACLRNPPKALPISIGLVVFIAIASHANAAERTPQANGKQVPSYVSARHQKPKTRTVHVNKAVIRSGPSAQNYPTSALDKGASVDVYLETSDGWSGIRPPGGSHDWIPSNVAYLLPGGKSAEIVESDSPAWIGSESKDVTEFSWVTSLQKTQQVQVLGEETQINDQGKKQLWYRISPPQGEFRWVRTSQLSDTMTAPEPASLAVPKENRGPIRSLLTQKNATEQSVQLATHVDETGSLNEATSAEGQIVWSDEQEVLAKIQRQIQNEQAEVQHELAAEGISIESGEESLLEEDSSHPQPSLRPIPMRVSQKRKAAEHQIDSMRQWDAMQSNDNPKLRVGPLRSVLGLIGISVIEAERAPPNAKIAHSYHTTRPPGNLGQVGPVGASRLDRLPRPGHRGPAVTLPPNGTYMNFDSQPQYGAPFEGAPTVGGMSGIDATSSMAKNHPMQPTQASPYQQGETTFSKWMNSQEPIFGRTQAMQPMIANGQMTSLNSFATNAPPNTPKDFSSGPTGMRPIAEIPQDTSAWHGLAPAMRKTNFATAGATSRPMEDRSTDPPEDFQTPEIQSALVALTSEVARPTEEWDLAALRTQASQWIENGSTAMVRGEARLLMERIDRFETLRQRTLGMAPNASMIAQRPRGGDANSFVSQNANTSNQVGPVVMAAAVGSGSGQAVTNASNVPYGQAGDASGWLVQVHTSVPGQPEFALTDDAGNVIAYVQSTAALNLRRYLQQPVTIYGVRGYIPNLAAKQILAERVHRIR